jgi:hypothetical protein
MRVLASQQCVGGGVRGEGSRQEGGVEGGEEGGVQSGGWVGPGCRCYPALHHSFHPPFNPRARACPPSRALSFSSCNATASREPCNRSIQSFNNSFSPYLTYQTPATPSFNPEAAQSGCLRIPAAIRQRPGFRAILDVQFQRVNLSPIPLHLPPSLQKSAIEAMLVNQDPRTGPRGAPPPHDPPTQTRAYLLQCDSVQ